MNKTYTKYDIVRLVSRRTGIKISVMSKFVSAVIISIADLLKEMGDGDRLEIRGFGIFTKYYFFPNGTRKNPKTNEPIKPIAKMKIKWTPSKTISKKMFV